MGKKYVVYEEDDELSGYLIIPLFFLFCMYVIYALLFGPYSDYDFNKPEYYVKARTAANELVLEWQGRNWRPRGFTDEFQIISNEPEFKTDISENEYLSTPQYLGNGVFQVEVETITLLKSKNGHTASVREGFIIKVISDSSHGFVYRLFKGDEWKILEAEQYYMNPTLPEINEMIMQWSGIIQKNLR